MVARVARNRRVEAVGIAILLLVAAGLAMFVTAVCAARVHLWAAGRNVAWAVTSTVHLVLALTVLFAVVVVWRREPPEAIGLHGTPRTIAQGGAGLALGVASALGAFAIAWAAGGYAVGWAPRAEWPGVGDEIAAIVALGLGAAFEEVVFRAGVAGTLSRAFSRPVAIVAPAIPFALAHLLNPHVSAAAEANIVLAGVVLGLLYFDPAGAPGVPSLGLCTGWHLGWNATIDALGIPVSGNPSVARYLHVRPVAAAWSGGEFGIEAGLGTTIVLAALVAWLGLRQRGAKLSGRATS